jgi:MOSC domain-containing protein YiiM
MASVVTAVSRSPRHTLVKTNEDGIRLLAGLGVEGDAHQGVTVKHRSRVARNPDAPNLRQVHLIHAELHDELRHAGFAVEPGQMGENITTSGVDLLGLAAGTLLYLGDSAVVAVTGLRNPCAQLDKIQKGLMAATLDRDAGGNLVRKAGIMGVVLASGEVRPGRPDPGRAPSPPPPAARRRLTAARLALAVTAGPRFRRKTASAPHDGSCWWRRGCRRRCRSPIPDGRCWCCGPGAESCCW